MPATSPQPEDTVHLLGSLLTFRATTAETGGAFSLVEVRTAPGQGAPPHLQRHDLEGFYVLEGAYEFTLDGQVRHCGPGSFVLAQKGVPHQFRNPSATDEARMLILNVPGGLHEGFFREAGDPVAAADGFPPMTTPDVPRLVAAGARQGIDFLPPG